MGATQIPTVPGGKDVGKIDPEGGRATQRLTLKCLGGKHPSDAAPAADYSPNGAAPIDRGRRD